MPLPPQFFMTSATAVLDTNVVLDWMVFQDPACQPLVHAIESGQLQWIATDAMRDELRHVIARGVLREWRFDESALWRTWDRWARSAAVPPSPRVPQLRCSDPDDQKFIELALNNACWLVSRDRAVLKLRHRAVKVGVGVVTPAQWAGTPCPLHIPTESFS